MDNAAKFKKFMRDKSVRQSEMALRLGIGQGKVSQIATGAIKPTLAQAIQIEIETDGAVDVRDWVEQRSAAA